MKNSINKKAIIAVTIIVSILVISGLLYVKNKPNKPVANAPVAATVVATVREASFGSVVNVSLSEAGKKQYAGAVKYQVYFEGKPVTSKEVLGKPTTAFPIRKEKDKVTIKLLKKDDKEAYSVELSLQKEKTAK